MAGAIHHIGFLHITSAHDMNSKNEREINEYPCQEPLIFPFVIARKLLSTCMKASSYGPTESNSSNAQQLSKDIFVVINKSRGTIFTLFFQLFLFN